MNFSIVIVTYNSKRWLKSLLNSATENYVIIDNNSTDGTTEIIQNRYSDVELIQQSSNIGFAAANNIGIQKAFQEGAEYIFLLNHDAWVREDTIEKLIAISKKHPEYGILSPIHLNGSGELLDWNFAKYISNPADEGRKLYSDLLLKKELQEVYDVNFVNAAAWLITRECIEKVGLFDAELFPHYGEDRNYVQRMHFHNFKIGIVPNSFVYHDRENRMGTHTVSDFDAHKKNIFLKLEASDPLSSGGLNNLDQTIQGMKDRLNSQRLKLNWAKIKQTKKLLSNLKDFKRRVLQNREAYMKEGYLLKR